MPHVRLPQVVLVHIYPPFQAMQSVQLLSFSGAAGEDVTLFLQQIKREAFTRDRHKDIPWLLDYIETALSGPALRWFSINIGNFDSWDNLRRAFLARFKDSANALPISPITVGPVPPARTYFPLPPTPAETSSTPYPVHKVSRESPSRFVGGH